MTAAKVPASRCDGRNASPQKPTATTPATGATHSALNTSASSTANPPSTKKSLASADSEYIYHVFLVTIHWDEDEDNDGDALVGTFGTLAEANHFAEMEALNENYHPETWKPKIYAKSTDANGCLTMEMDEVYVTKYADLNRPYEGRESARVEVRRQKCVQSPPVGGPGGNHVWVVLGKTSIVAICQTDIGARKAVERKMAKMEEKDEGGYEYLVERNGLVGTRVKGAVREEIVWVKKWMLQC